MTSAQHGSIINVWDFLKTTKPMSISANSANQKSTKIFSTLSNVAKNHGRKLNRSVRPLKRQRARKGRKAVASQPPRLELKLKSQKSLSPNLQVDKKEKQKKLQYPRLRQVQFRVPWLVANFLPE